MRSRQFQNCLDMKPFNNLVSPPFYTIFYASARDGVDAGLYSQAIATLVSAATMRGSFLGFTSDEDGEGNAIKIAYWTTYQANRDWIKATKDLLPYRIQLENCLGPSGCLWPWLNRLEVSDIELEFKAA